jgi:Sodium/hydrogen exchanger family
MIPMIQILVLLLVVAAAVAVVATRLEIPPAILLVLTGVALALVPGLPTVELAPELVLLLVLPPVIYSSAVSMSWREFRFSLRLITLLAVGCVVFTTVATAAAAHWLLGLAWPVGFVLGAIVSPPDPVAPLSIARRMQLPRRILVVLEGEGLSRLSRARQRRGDRDALRLDVSRNVSSALALSVGQAQGSIAALAVAVRPGVHRGPRHRLARGGAGDPVCNCERTTVPRPRSDSLPDIFCHPGDVGGSRLDAARSHSRARPRSCRPSRAPR